MPLTYGDLRNETIPACVARLLSCNIDKAAIHEWAGE
jgi:hypothetical protein